jgi:ubiquinone/menaquinone biosynthesis C-methylase UbiE
MTATEKVHCPICDCDTATVVRQSADIVVCSNCGITYLRTRPSVNELENYYQTYASNPGSHMRLPDTIQLALGSGLRREWLLSEILMHIGQPSGKRILDVGCGWGAFLSAARDRRMHVEGVEICKQMSDYANTRLNIKVQNCQVEEARLDQRSFDVVSLIHSLEHLPNQRTALGLFHDLLKDEGFVCGIVPNFNSYCSNALRDKWPWLDANVHYTHYTPETLSKTLWLFGFNVHKLYTASGDFYPDLLRQTVSAGHKGISGDALSRKIKEIEARDEGEEIRFVAQRI